MLRPADETAFLPTADGAGRPDTRGCLDLLARYARDFAQTLEVDRIYALTLEAALTLSGASAGLICTRVFDGMPWKTVVSQGLDRGQHEALHRALNGGQLSIPDLLSLPLLIEHDAPVLLHLLDANPATLPAENLAAI